MRGKSMRTTVTLDDNLVRELVEISGMKTKTAAVTSAIREQIRRAKLKRLSDLLGKIAVDEKAFEEGNELDLNRAAWLERLGGENDAP